jgi:hypothetical protein
MFIFSPPQKKFGVLENWSSGVMGLNKKITDLETPKIEHLTI